jgi:hypothetical protein
MEAGGAPESLRMCGDWITYCRILRKGSIAYISEPLNYHRQHPANHTSNSVLDLSYFSEFLYVQEYIGNAFNLNEDEKDRAFFRFLREWDRLTISSYGRINLYNTYRLAKIAFSYHNKLSRDTQIAAHMIINSVKSLMAKWKRN